MKRYKPEEIVGLSRQADVLHRQGMSMAGAIRQIGVSGVTFYRYREGARRPKGVLSLGSSSAQADTSALNFALQRLLRVSLTTCMAADTASKVEMAQKPKTLKLRRFLYPNLIGRGWDE